MKRSIIILAVIFSSCSTSVVPPPSNSIVSHGFPLLVTDTLDFGSIPVGTSSTLNLDFKDTGSDTVEIISESLSDSSFSFPNFASTLFAIVPGQEIKVPIQFQAKDYAPHMGFDSVRSHSNSLIVPLRGSGRLFSSMFDVPPKEIYVELKGLLGNWDGPPTTDFEFDAGSLTRWKDTIELQNSYNDPVYGSDPNYPCGYNGNTTQISFLIDTSSHSITWLDASYSEDDERDGVGCGHGGMTIDKTLIAHNIPLTKNGNVWAAVLKGTTLSSFINAASYNSSSGGVLENGQDATLKSIIGYDSTATLSISIY